MSNLRSELIGQVFADRYEVQATLGVGGMGCVLRAFDRERKIDVALKLMRQDLLQVSPDRDVLLARFRREMELSQQFRHPNLVQSWDYGTDGKTLYISAELISGGSLDRILLGTPRLSLARALRFMRGVLGGLGALWEMDVIHRDIKPANILITHDDCAKITDFGLARATSAERDQLTSRGDFVGTPLYASPEQIQGMADLDIRVDLYALGAMVFHWLTGQPPYVGSHPVQIMKKHLREPVPDIREQISGLPDEFCELLMSMLAKDRRQRPETPKAVLEILDGLKVELEACQTGLVQAGALVPLLGNDETMLPSESPLPPSGNQTVAFAAKIPLPTKDRLKRAAVIAESGSFRHTIYAYAQTSLIVGRNRADEPGHDLCLRLSPDDPRNGELSGRHFQMRCGFEGGRPILSIEDLNSRNGTRVDGERLQKGEVAKLTGQHELCVAEVLTLEVRVLATGRPGLAPVLILRRQSRTDQSYLLLPPGTAVSLGLSSAGELSWGAAGPFRLLNRDGGVVLQSADETSCEVGGAILVEEGSVSLRRFEDVPQR